MDFTNGMKKVFLASVGAAATTAEVTKDILEKMIEKGERTVEHGKALQKEKQEAEEDVEVEESEATTDSETSQVQEDETEQ